jgi:hypothetical protein
MVAKLEMMNDLIMMNDDDLMTGDVVTSMKDADDLKMELKIDIEAKLKE